MAFVLRFVGAVLAGESRFLSAFVPLMPNKRVLVGKPPVALIATEAGIFG